MAHKKTHKVQQRPPFECIALLLQGGGALGAYQGGVYEALAEAGIHPDWVAGISIGAINSAIIAGNPEKDRVSKLRQFWESITSPSWAQVEWFRPDSVTRGIMNQLFAGEIMVKGVPGFFLPRLPVPWLQPHGTEGATSYYDTSPLYSTLERFIDFDRINADTTRFSIGAVNVRTGNFIYFDNTTHTIMPSHIVASGALPPGFPAVEIEGEYYWDGGLVSNTPLDWVLESRPQHDTLAFQVDLWNARGDMPCDIAKVMTRQKEIQYSSRTRANTDRFKRSQKLRYAAASLLDKLPKEMQELPEVELLREASQRKVYNIIQLIYHTQGYEGDSKDYEFSRQSMEEHWKAGYYDTVRTLRHTEVLERPKGEETVFTFDIARDGRD